MLMGWLKNVFGRPETRSSYTDLRIQSALQLADGTGYVGDVRHTAALETVCRLYEAVFAVAAVRGTTLAPACPHGDLAGSDGARHAPGRGSR